MSKNALNITDINENSMGIQWETNGNLIGSGRENVKGISKVMLNAVETALLKFVYKNRKLITGNAYHWWAEKLGYKKKNTIYEWFYNNPVNSKYSNNAKIGLRDIKEIYRITKDENILQSFIEECRNEDR